MTTVIVYGDIDHAVSVFKRRVARDGILQEFKARQHYQSPTERRRAKLRKAERRKMRQELRTRRARDGGHG